MYMNGRIRVRVCVGGGGWLYGSASACARYERSVNEIKWGGVLLYNYIYGDTIVYSYIYIYKKRRDYEKT